MKSSPKRHTAEFRVAMKLRRRFYWVYIAQLKSGGITLLEPTKFRDRMVRVKVTLAPLSRKAK